MGSTNVLDSVLTVEDYMTKKLGGKTDDKIAKEYFVSTHTLRMWKAKAGIKIYHVNLRRYDIIKEMRQRGKSTVEIAKVLNLTREQCLNIEKRYKVV